MGSGGSAFKEIEQTGDYSVIEELFDKYDTDGNGEKGD